MGHVMFLTVIKLDFVLNVTTVLGLGQSSLPDGSVTQRVDHQDAFLSPPPSFHVLSGFILSRWGLITPEKTQSRKTRVRLVRRSMLDANCTSDCGSASTFLLSPLPNSVGVQPATGKIIPISNAPKD